MNSPLKLGTRGSLLARTQSAWVANLIDTPFSVSLTTIKTEGDNLDLSLTKPSQPGAFVNALRDALLNDEVDFIVHSLKDLPSADHADLELVAIPLREDNRDVFVSKGSVAFGELQANSLIGTSSPRRAAALRHLNPDLLIKPIRGNIETRIGKVRAGEFDGTILAAAGIIRLGLEKEIAEYFSIEDILPAPAQGALAVECRKNDLAMIELLAKLDHQPTRLVTTAERSILRALNAGCDLAIGAFAQIDNGTLTLTAEIGDDSTGEIERHWVSAEISGSSDFATAEQLGQRTAAHFRKTDLGIRILSSAN